MHASDDNRRHTHLPDAAATQALGAAIGAACLFSKDLTPAAVIYLEGDLGAGKTTLVSGLLRGNGGDGNAKSPTYTLVELHVISGLNLYHFDFYRFKFPEEFLDAGLDEYFSRCGLCLVEWPDKAAPHTPAADLRVSLQHVGAARAATLVAVSARGREWLSRLPSSPGASSCASPAPD